MVDKPTWAEMLDRIPEASGTVWEQQQAAMLRVCSECGNPTDKHPTNWCLPGMGPAPHVVPKPGYPKSRG